MNIYYIYRDMSFGKNKIQNGYTRKNSYKNQTPKNKSLQYAIPVNDLSEDGYITTCSASDRDNTQNQSNSNILRSNSTNDPEANDSPLQYVSSENVRVYV